MRRRNNMATARLLPDKDNSQALAMQAKVMTHSLHILCIVSAHACYQAPPGKGSIV